MNTITNAYQNICKESVTHLKERRQSYCGHLYHTWAASFHCMRASFALLIHGAVPAWCKTTGSTIVVRLAEDIVEHPSYESTVTKRDLK
jgi:cbb3-type cytochrome oxidase subunit 1